MKGWRCPIVMAGAAVLAMAIPRWAHAQEGPIVVGEPRQLRPLEIDRPSAVLTLVSTYSRQASDSNVQDDRSSRELRFEEILGLSTTGHIFHPNFIFLNLQGEVGFSQARSRIDGDSERTSEELYTWDLSGTYRRDGNSPFTLYTRRTRELIRRDFGPTLESITTQHGGTLELRGQSVNTVLNAYRLESEQNGLTTGEQDYRLTENTFQWFTFAQPTLNQTIRWNYIFEDVTQRGTGISDEYQSHDAYLAHTLRFGAEGASSLESSLRFYDLNGNFDVQRIRLDEWLRLKHTPTFETDYRYTFQRQISNGTEQTQHRGQAGFKHYLYESLITTGHVGAQYTNLDGDSRTTDYFTAINFDYRKRVPLGRLFADLGLGYSLQENDARVTPIRVIDQSVMFSDAIPVVIAEPAVVPGSLVVTDPSGLLLFSPGIDYEIRPVPGGLELTRIVGGRISPGQAVLVDYTLAPDAGSTVTTTNLSTGVRYTISESYLRGLSLFARYHRQDQDIDAESASVRVPNETEDVLVGAEYKISDLTAGVEQQWHDATLSPYDATRFYVRYLRPIGPETTLSINAAHNIIDFTDVNEQVDLTTASVQVRHHLTRQLSILGTVLWRNEESSTRGRTRGLEEQLELNFRHRQTEMFLKLRNSDLTTSDRDDSFQFFQFGLRREF